jgi:hypothetical protein
MSTTDYDEYFLNGPASGVGGGGGGGVAAGAGGLRFGRNGRTTTNTPLRITGSAQMQFTNRGYAVFTRFSFQNFVWWGLTNDGTNIGLEVRQGRVVAGTLTVVQSQIIDLPSSVTNNPYRADLPAPFDVEVDDLLFVRIVNSPSGGTAADVNNCSIQFRITA